MAKLFADRGPLVLSFEKLIPVFLGLFPRNESAKRGNVQYHAVVEVGFEMQVRHPTKFALVVCQFRKEILLAFDLFGESFRFLPRITR